jgi:hypothetical protein
MSDLLSELRSKWNQALASGAGRREWRGVALTAVSLVTLLAGIRDRDDRISILIESALQHGPRHRVRLQTEGVSLVDQRLNDEGTFRLAVTLERPDLRDIFEILVIDLITVAATPAMPEDCIARIIRRLEAWQACLRIRQRGLKREEQAGLVGELMIASLVAEEIGLPQALAAWSGPLDAVHDFQNEGVAIEVKTTLGISQQIRISLLDQLSSRGLEALLLARVRLQESPSGKTLPELVAAVRTVLAEKFPNAVASFEDKLLRAGYLDVDIDIYASTRNALNDIRVFHVTEAFPRLTRESLPPAIVEAAYFLDERQLAAHRLSEFDFRSAIRRMSINA